MIQENNEQFEELMRRLSSGDELAVDEFLRRFGRHLLRAVRRKLDSRLRSKFESSDFTQAVWASFFENIVHGRQFASPEEVVASLNILVHNKLVDAFRKFLVFQKNNLAREGDAAEQSMQQLVADVPTPSAIAVAREQWRTIVMVLPLNEQRMVSMRMGGETLEAIALRFGLSERTVRRVFKRLENSFVP